jgi:hypothetical protein
VSCAPGRYPVGGSVSGLLSGTSLALLDNGGDRLVITANGAFTFGTLIPFQSAYSVTVAAQPLGQQCVVGGSDGTMGGAAVASVSVTCTPNLYRVGGTLSGLRPSASVVLQNNGGDSTTLSVNGPFDLGARVASGAAYAVTVLTQPTGQGCSVDGGTGTMAGGDVGTVAVTCATTGRYGATATLLNDGRVLVAGGSNATDSLATAELFDPAANGGGGGFVPTGSMGTARLQATATLLNSGSVLIAGGYGQTGELATAELFDPAGNGGRGAFTTTWNLTAPRYLATATLLDDGRVLVAGGQIGTAFEASAELFDPAADGGAGAFIATGSLAFARTAASAVLLESGKVLIAGGGLNPLAYLSSAELFDPTGNGGAGSFGPTGGMSHVRYFAVAVRLRSGKVLIAGGNDGAVTATAELYDPAANAGAGAFAPTGSMQAMRENATAVLLPDGTVQVAGGYDSAVVLESSEVFDPAGNSGVGAFTASASMTEPRTFATATLLQMGKVLIAGGLQVHAGAYVALWTAELFDPAANAGGGLSTPTADLSVP